MSETFVFEGVVPFVVMGCKTVATIFSGIYSMLGENGANALLYNVGRKTGAFYVQETKKKLGLQKLELLNECIAGDLMAKWGKFEYDVDFNTFEGEVILYDSFLAKSWIELTKKNQEYPVCAFLSGYIAGVIESVFGEEVIVEERDCAVLGNEFCLFKVKKNILGD